MARKANPRRTATAWFFALMAFMAVLVFIYTYFSGGGELAKNYVPWYYPLGVGTLVIMASFDKRRDKKEDK
jgi:hypothetical protein